MHDFFTVLHCSTTYNVGAMNRIYCEKNYYKKDSSQSLVYTFNNYTAVSGVSTSMHYGGHW